MRGKKLTTQTYLEDLLCKNTHPDGKYNYKMIEYISSLDKIDIYCNDCGKLFWQRPDHHKRGVGCPWCAIDAKHTTERFIEDMLCSGIYSENKYNYKMVEYIGDDKKIEIYCNDCKVSFWQTPSNHKRGRGCIRCRNKMSNILYLQKNLTIEEEPIKIDDRIQCKCTYCKKYFTPTISQLQSRTSSLLKNGNGEHRLYCSDKCKQLCPIFGKSKYPKDFQPDRSREVQPELRKIVLERDNFECQRCNSREDLHCHHITGVEINPVESADIDNCITLCYTCHGKVHSSGQCDVRRQKCII
jgi:5-methylcytosine-specific restriction endonuclease McrA